MDLFALKTILLLFALCGRAAANSILPEGPVDGVLGKNVTLSTLVAKPDYMVIIWNYSDGEETRHIATVGPGTLTVNEPYKGRVHLNDTNGELSLMSLKPEDSGDYSISMVLKTGMTSTGEIKLRVLEPVSDVAIKSSLPEAVEHNSTVVLTCTAKGSFLNFTWLNRTAPVMVDGRRVFLKEEELSSELTIVGVLRSELVGPIYCTATNKLESERSAPFNLTVYYGPEDVRLHPAKPAKFIPARSGFNLTCLASSSPAPTYMWFYNEEQVKYEGPVLQLDLIEKLGYGKKEGYYSCAATNVKTKRVVRSPQVNFGVMEPISGVTITGPTDVLLAGNSTANVSCTAALGVVQTRTWTKDGKPLSAGGRVAFSADKSSVSISPVQKEDNGKYACQLANPVNTEQAVYNMVVNHGPETPSIDGREAVEVDDPVTLTCSATSVPPATYTWKFNGTLTPVKTATYTIDKALYSHSGSYTCEAHNAVTGQKTSKAFTLSVKEELVEGLSDGAIAGIVIGVLVALIAAIALVFYCRQKVPVDSPY